MSQTSAIGAAPSATLTPADELYMPRHKGVVRQYVEDPPGRRELRLYHGRKEIAFDDPAQFAFAEGLGRQARFRGQDAADWARRPWPEVRDLLQALVDEGVLRRDAPQDEPAMMGDRARPSPLPPAPARKARNWSECAAITAELAGRALEPGWLEHVVPVFRVAHVALDADGRQVGEANVFPKALRLEVPTEWRACAYPGTRYQDARPMNHTALMAMRTHWPQMMAVLAAAREAYLSRFPEARAGWTVGHVERLATVVLAIPTFQHMQANGGRASRPMHPALSSVFRVTDGLRLVMHQMMFIPVGEPTRAPDAPITSGEIFAYAERNHSFHSEQGVCAGPRIMVEEFLRVLVDGQPPRGGAAEALDDGVREALETLDSAVDYGLLGLRIYAATFSLWPAMVRAYERIAEAAARLPGGAASAFRDRMAQHMADLAEGTFLAQESWRRDRDTVFGDMFAQCGRGLGLDQAAASLAERLGEGCVDADAAGVTLDAILARRAPWAPADVRGEIVTAAMDFMRRMRAAFAVSAEAQAQVNALLGRRPPQRPFAGLDLDIHNRLLDASVPRLPYLLGELEALFGAVVQVDAQSLRVHEAHA